jgi:hypothetical protein
MSRIAILKIVPPKHRYEIAFLQALLVPQASRRVSVSGGLL